MKDHDVFDAGDGRRIAYHKVTAQGDGVNQPGVVFLGGFRSDMEGTKALMLDAWARRTGRAFLRFDYTGHGASSGAFLDGAIGDWAQDARDAITALTEGPQVLVGSSMGGWIAYLAARAMPERVAGLVGIAAAPDFTENGMWAGFSVAEKRDLEKHGRVEQPSEYSDAPYVITRRLIEDGRAQTVLDKPLILDFPVRLLHGTADADVPIAWTLATLDHARCPDMSATFVKDADHRFSTPENLALIERTLEEVLACVPTG